MCSSSHILWCCLFLYYFYLQPNRFCQVPMHRLISEIVHFKYVNIIIKYYYCSYSVLELNWVYCFTKEIVKKLPQNGHNFSFTCKHFTCIVYIQCWIIERPSQRVLFLKRNCKNNSAGLFRIYKPVLCLCTKTMHSSSN